MTPQQTKFLHALPTSWQKPLALACQSPEIHNLITFLLQREQAGAHIYPAKQHIFAALSATPFDKVSVVIVGQDPYHGPGQAHGLSFSVPEGFATPPSLRNIYKELHADIGMQIPGTGNLMGWAHQGVLLLNSILTVEQGTPAAHAQKGWEFFTDAIIEQLLLRNHPTVFMLWGAYAQKKLQHLQSIINPSKHLILKAAHPSPLSIRGFLGCKHFSKANAFLKQHNEREIDWNKLI